MVCFIQICICSGEAIFVSAGERELTFVGQGVIIRATTGDLPTRRGFAA